MNKRIKSYIEQFSQLFNGTPWLDETFSKKLDNLTEEQVFQQAPNNNHSVAEVMSHLIVWRKEILRRLIHNSSSSSLTDQSFENWLPLNQLKQTGWQSLKNSFNETQQQLIQFLESKEDNFLDQKLADTEYNMEYYVAGLVHHDAYHLGQIGLILKWVK